MADLSSTEEPIPLFDALIPIALGHQLGSAIVTYPSANEEAATLLESSCAVFLLVFLATGSTFEGIG